LAASSSASLALLPHGGRSAGDAPGNLWGGARSRQDREPLRRKAGRPSSGAKSNRPGLPKAGLIPAVTEFVRCDSAPHLWVVSFFLPSHQSRVGGIVCCLTGGRNLTSSGAYPVGQFATNLPANLLLACFCCPRMHFLSRSKSLVNNSKHAQRSFSVLR
jgi:hypothetical protein